MQRHQCVGHQCIVVSLVCAVFVTVSVVLADTVDGIRALHRSSGDRDVERVRHDAVTDVIDVIDGDTVRVAYHGEPPVRILGIDTPETVHPDQPVECGGPHASAVARRLLGGRTVRLVFDPSQHRLDTYGRTLAYVQAAGVGDYGLTMLRRGLAVTTSGPVAFARQRRYLSAESRARAAQRGLWARCPATFR